MTETYESSSLTETLKNYTQAEKGTLAIVFGYEKLNSYYYYYYFFFFLNNYIVESDHKPLEAIFKNLLQNDEIFPSAIQVYY